MGESGHMEQRPRVRVAAVIRQDNAVLMVRHDKPGGVQNWLLPGGGVDWGEALHEALEREVREECGLAIEPRDILWVHDTIAPDGSRHVVNIYFEAETLGGEPAPGEDPIIGDVRYIADGELKYLAFYPDVREDLLRYLRGNTGQYSRYLGSLWR